MFLCLLVVAVGLVLGSFTTAVIHRSQKNISYIRDNGKGAARSECPSCQHQLGVRDLMPVLSWLFQVGKCRYCGVKISPFYPLVEVFTALVCFFVFVNLSIVKAALLFPVIPFLVAFLYRLFFEKRVDKKLFLTFIAIGFLDIILFFVLK